MPRCNTPPREGQIEDDIGDIEEVYEIGDDDDLDFLEEGAEGDVEDSEEMDPSEGSDEEADEAQANTVIYSCHKGSVFCCALSPTENLGASGGEDDMAYVWDIDSGTTLFECTRHKDSVTTLAFSHDGTYLATGDMSGFIQVWKVSTKTSIWEFETEELNWMTWHPSSNVLLAGTISGEVWMWLIPKGNTKSLGHVGASSECGALTRDGKRLCVGYMDGSVRVLDLKSGQTLHSCSSHDTQLTSISTHQDNALLLTGSMDGRAKLLNASSGKVVASLDAAILQQSDSSSEEDQYEHSIEVVSFCPSISNLAVVATLSGIITIWDITHQVARHHIIQGCGTGSVVWHPTKPYFLAAGLDGALRVFDVRSAEQLCKFKGHRSHILSCDIKKDGSKVVTSSDDSTVRILSTTNLWP